MRAHPQALQMLPPGGLLLGTAWPYDAFWSYAQAALRAQSCTLFKGALLGCVGDGWRRRAYARTPAGTPNAAAPRPAWRHSPAVPGATCGAGPQAALLAQLCTTLAWALLGCVGGGWCRRAHARTSVGMLQGATS